VLVGFRLRLFTLAEELGNISEACRVMGVAWRARSARRSAATSGQPDPAVGYSSSDVGADGLFEELRTGDSGWASPNHLAGRTRMVTPKVTEVRRGSAHNRAVGAAKGPAAARLIRVRAREEHRSRGR
jgi:hypothetical protein